MTNPLTAVAPRLEGEIPASLDGAPRRARRPPEPALTLNVELAGWLVVLAVAALLRLLDLGAVPLRPDESLTARATLDFARGEVTPDWAGDLTSALAALLFKLFGDGDTTARLAPALLGLAGVAALALYRPLIGRAAALLGALLVALSPAAVLGARTLGPEAAALPLSLLLPPVAASVWLDDRPNRLPLLALVVGVGLGTGALVPAMAIVVAAWLAVELAWLDGRAAVNPIAPLRPTRRTLLLTALALLPGLALAVGRYGAGLDRVTLSSLRAWQGPPPLARPLEAWHYVPNVLAAYEPLAAVLGAVGLVVVLRRWRSSADAGGRLLAVWALSGACIVALWLHRDPAHLQLLTVPLALLAGVATVRVTAALTAPRLGRALIATLPPLVAAGIFVVLAVRWAFRDRIPASEAAVLMLVAVGAALAALAVCWLARAPVGVPALLLGWLLLGALTLHASTYVAFGRGAEILAGQRTRVESAAIVRELETTAPPGAVLRVERRLWPALAWPLRDRAVERFVEVPPAGPAAIVVTGGANPLAEESVRGTPVAERWAPTSWDALGILRWWVYRTPWGISDVLRGAVVDR